jgi:hypothetical protein
MKQIIPVLLAALALSLLPSHAQSNKTIRILVGFPAGGGTDVIARHLAERLKDELKANVIVENKAGAGGQLAAQALKAASGDGSLFFLSHDHTISIIPLTAKAPGFDPVKDFVPVAGFASFVNAWALSSSTPAKTLPEYIDFVKASSDVKVLAVGVPAPASAPEFLVGAVAARFSRDTAKPLSLNKLTALGLNVQYSTGVQLAQRERAYSAAWAKVIEERGFKLQ